jgi:hypothetical protein
MRGTRNETYVIFALVRVLTHRNKFHSSPTQHSHVDARDILFGLSNKHFLTHGFNRGQNQMKNSQNRFNGLQLFALNGKWLKTLRVSTIAFYTI